MRALPVLEATLKSTLPFPFALAPAVTVSHGALLDAVHAHPAFVETVTVVPGPPAESKDWLVGLIAYPHPPAPACETVSTCRATSTVPMRGPAVLAATLRPIVPSPLPSVPEVIAIHGTLLVALQEQPPPAVTPTA
jgi:hypothetical protein